MAFLQGFAPNLACFIAGRTIQGLGVGFLSMTVPVIQTEIAAPHKVYPLISGGFLQVHLLIICTAWFDGRRGVYLLNWWLYAFLLDRLRFQFSASA